MSDQFVSQAAENISAGKITEARKILMQVIKDNPRNEEAWLLLVQTLPTDAMRISALEQCLKYFPQSQKALLGLERLTARQPAPDSSSTVENTPPTARPLADGPLPGSPAAGLPPVPHFEQGATSQAGNLASAPDQVEPGLPVLKSYHPEVEDQSRPPSILSGLNTTGVDQTAPTGLQNPPEQLAEMNAAVPTVSLTDPGFTPNETTPAEIEELRAAKTSKRPKLTLRSGLRAVLIVFYAVVLIGGGWVVWQRYGSDITAWFKALPQAMMAAVSPSSRSTQQSGSQTSLTPGSPAGGEQGEILYLSKRGDLSDLYVNYLNGQPPTLLIASDSKSSEISDPAWSADGNQIAFIRGEGQKTDLFTSSADGSGIVVQTNDHAGNAHPSWAPDGNRIVFVSQRNGGQDLYIMTISTREVHRLIQNAGKNFSPAWSPDGRRIAFVSDRDGFSRLYLINPDGGNLVALSDEEQNVSNPAWSPDSKWIAFSIPARKDRLLYVYAQDGVIQNRITFSPGQDDHPSWSPDGSWIVFTSERGNLGQPTLYMVRPDGKDIRLLDTEVHLDSSPVWSPVIKK